MDGSPARWFVLIHQLHVAGEEGGSTTIVAVFLPVLPVGVVLWLSSRDVTRSSYVAFGTKKTKGGAGAGNILSHIGVHHTKSMVEFGGQIDTTQPRARGNKHEVWCTPMWDTM